MKPGPRETWYILKGETCGPNGRTYRTRDGILEVWSNQKWLRSFFRDLEHLKSFARHDYPKHQLTQIQKEKKSG